jgi:hypothetical protein
LGYLVLYLCFLFFFTFGFLPHLVGVCSFFMPERIGLRQAVR